MHAPTRIHAEKAAPARGRSPAWTPVSAGPRGHLGAALAAAGVQAKLRVAEPGDASEKEADRVAERILSMPEPKVATAPPGARHPIAQPAVRRAIAPAPASAGGLPDDLANRIEGLSRGGDPLPQAVRRYFEPRFGQDFSRVRIHTGAEPAQASQEIGARAFTVGEHISFASDAYHPQTQEGRRLLAHELTHVVQQRSESRREIRRDIFDDAGAALGGGLELVEGVAGDVGEAIEVAGEAIEDPMSLVRRYAPGLVPILEQGPFEYLKGLLGEAFDAVVGGVTALLPEGGAAGLLGTFGDLLARGLGILEALAAGDCGPFLAALGELQTFLSETAGEAWNGLVELLSPIGDFFSDLWASTGAPAVEWLSEFAGDLWDGITELGQDIWDWTQPVRDAFGAAWDWVKEQLFGPEDDSGGDSSGGVVGWLGDLAGEAWAWVQEQTRPVWEPLSEAVEFVRELIPPAFVRELGEMFSGLGANLDGARAGIGTEGDRVAENREALAAALPSVQELIALARGGISSAREWLIGRITEVSGGVRAFLGALGSVPFLAGLSGGLSWLDALMGDLSTWGTDTVGGLFDSLLAGFDIVSPYLETLLGIVQEVITVASDLMQLPSLVLGELWGLVPECLSGPIEDFLLHQILGRIPIFSSLLEIPDIWARVEAVALEILTQVFVDGDLAGAAWTFFSNVLALIGIPPDLVVRILAKAATAVGSILTDPIGFLLNLVSAAVQGFAQFFENIGSHLLDGVAGWLFGAVAEAGLTLPTDLSFASIIGFVFQILDITIDRVFSRLALQVGPEVVANLRGALDVATGVWSWVVILVNEGPAGLWEDLQEQLSGLWSTVLQSAVTWISEVVITQSVLWLASFVDISGITAIVNTLIAIYRAVESAAAYLNDMLLIVDRFLDGVVGIAEGDLDQAAGFMENALARTLPVAIGFLAYQCGLGNVGSHVRELVEAVREMVNAGLDWLIERAITMGRAVLDLARRGVAAVREWWRARKVFRTASGEEHTLDFEGGESGAELMIASSRRPYRTFLEGLGDLPPALSTTRAEAEQIAAELDQAVRAARVRPGAPAEATPGPDPRAEAAARVPVLLDQLAIKTALLLGANGPQMSTPPVYGGLQSGSAFGTRVEITRLGPAHPVGSVPSSGDMGSSVWRRLNRRRVGGGSASYYIKGHLLNEQLGGPGNTWQNLTPLTREGNADHFERFERAVKAAVNGSSGDYDPRVALAEPREAVRFIVTANYVQRDTAVARSQHVTGWADKPQAEKDAILDVMRAEASVPETLTCTAEGTNFRMSSVPIENPVDGEDASFTVV